MVREGYKQTEVGVIPEDWELKTIGDIGFVTSGGTPLRTNSLYWGGNIPWITTNQINFNVIKWAEQFITEVGLKNSAAKLFPPGTLLMAMYGQGKTRGKVAILGLESSTNQACAAISLNESVKHNYVFHYLISQYEAIRDLSNTGSQENLNGLIIKSIKIPIPPLSEQRTIAQALSDVDALIAALDKLIAKKRQIKTATMQQLLTGKKRLPGFEGKWEEKKIGDFTDCTAGGTPSTLISYYWGGFIKWMNSGELNKKVVHDVEGRITEAGLKNSSTKVVPANCVLIGLAGQGKTRGTVALNTVELCTNQSIAAIYPNKKIFDSQYLFYNLESRYEELRSLSTGEGGRGGLNLKIIRNILLPFPSLKEQRAIAQILSDIDTEIITLEKRSTKTQAIKQGMMQELLTGRTRLSFDKA
jgi:type I restriction enzyme S subunit